jgi:hypothetical protein
MPPKFSTTSFDFLPGDNVPEHDEGYAMSTDPRDPSKYHLDGFDTFDRSTYPLAHDIDTLEEAELLVKARRRSLERTQPSSSSGGQAGIQDRVSIVYPDPETEERVRAALADVDAAFEQIEQDQA